MSSPRACCPEIAIELSAIITEKTTRIWRFIAFAFRGMSIRMRIDHRHDLHPLVRVFILKAPRGRTGTIGPLTKWFLSCRQSFSCRSCDAIVRFHSHVPQAGIDTMTRRRRGYRGGIYLRYFFLCAMPLKPDILKEARFYLTWLEG